MRSVDPTTGRKRGAQRAGLSKHHNSQVAGTPLRAVRSVVYDNKTVNYTELSGELDDPGFARLEQEWSENAGSNESSRNVVTDTAGSSYWLSGRTIEKRNGTTGVMLWTYTLPVEDKAFILGPLAIGPDLALHVGVESGPGKSEGASVYRIRQAPVANSIDTEPKLDWVWQTGTWVKELRMHEGSLKVLEQSDQNATCWVSTLFNLSGGSPIEASRAVVPYPATCMIIRPDGSSITGHPYLATRDSLPLQPGVGIPLEGWTIDDLEDSTERVWCDLRAEDITGLEDGDEVEIWQDRSGNNRNMMGYTAGSAGVPGDSAAGATTSGYAVKPPTYRSVGSTRSPSIYFDGSKAMKSNNGGGTDANRGSCKTMVPNHGDGAYCLFIVCRPETSEATGEDSTGNIDTGAKRWLFDQMHSTAFSGSADYSGQPGYDGGKYNEDFRNSIFLNSGCMGDGHGVGTVAANPVFPKIDTGHSITIPDNLSPSGVTKTFASNTNISGTAIEVVHSAGLGGAGSTLGVGAFPTSNQNFLTAFTTAVNAATSSTWNITAEADDVGPIASPKVVTLRHAAGGEAANGGLITRFGAFLVSGFGSGGANNLTRQYTWGTKGTDMAGVTKPGYARPITSSTGWLGTVTDTEVATGADDAAIALNVAKGAGRGGWPLEGQFDDVASDSPGEGLCVFTFMNCGGLAETTEVTGNMSSGTGLWTNGSPFFSIPIGAAGKVYSEDGLLSDTFTVASDSSLIIGTTNIPTEVGGTYYVVYNDRNLMSRSLWRINGRPIDRWEALPMSLTGAYATANHNLDVPFFKLDLVPHSSFLGIGRNTHNDGGQPNGKAAPFMGEIMQVLTVGRRKFNVDGPLLEGVRHHTAPVVLTAPRYAANSNTRTDVSNNVDATFSSVTSNTASTEVEKIEGWLMARHGISDRLPSTGYVHPHYKNGYKHVFGAYDIPLTDAVPDTYQSWPPRVRAPGAMIAKHDQDGNMLWCLLSEVPADNVGFGDLMTRDINGKAGVIGLTKARPTAGLAQGEGDRVYFAGPGEADGQYSMGHLEDSINPEDPGIIGTGWGRLSGDPVDNDLKLAFASDTPIRIQADEFNNLHVPCPPGTIDPITGVEVVDAMRLFGPDGAPLFRLTARPSGSTSYQNCYAIGLPPINPDYHI
jgi:hypothetical protein